MKEHHNIFRAESVSALLEMEKSYFDAHTAESFVFKRYFLGEPSQRTGFPDVEGAVSHICQRPLDGSGAAVWIYSVEGAEVQHKGHVTVVRHGDTEQFWQGGLNSLSTGSEAQTREILEAYEAALEADGMSIAENCVRTWFFCRDIDSNYAGLVKGRKENFIGEGLTEHTHYIASTGIAGIPSDDRSIVLMDAVALRGNFSQTYLYAPENLNPTYEYGVTFERGVKVDFAGRSHIFISGTASIDNKGRVVHVGDVGLQTLRMWKNIEALLKEGGAGWGDVRQAIVYLRNPSDYEVVAPMFKERFGDDSFPYIITHAAVCRPDWLIEMECLV